MTCSDFEVLLLDYTDGMLGRAGAAAMERHLGQCAGCGMLYRNVSGLVEDLHHLPEFPPPGRLARSILERTTGAPRPESFWKSVVEPTFQPFLTQRFRVAVAIAFICAVLALNFSAPGSPALATSDFFPGGLYLRADTASHRAYRRLLQANQQFLGLRDSVAILASDLSSRVDYETLSALFGGDAAM